MPAYTPPHFPELVPEVQASGFSFVCKPGMLVKTRWRSYMPEKMGPFAYKIFPEDLVEGSDGITLSKTRFETISPNEICMVVRVLSPDNVVILYGEELFCIKSDFLRALRPDEDI